MGLSIAYWILVIGVMTFYYTEWYSTLCVEPRLEEALEAQATGRNGPAEPKVRSGYVSRVAGGLVIGTFVSWPVLVGIGALWFYFELTPTWVVSLMWWAPLLLLLALVPGVIAFVQESRQERRSEAARELRAHEREFDSRWKAGRTKARAARPRGGTGRSLRVTVYRDRTRSAISCTIAGIALGSGELWVKAQPNSKIASYFTIAALCSATLLLVHLLSEVIELVEDRRLYRPGEWLARPDADPEPAADQTSPPVSGGSSADRLPPST